jgi:hypothetical protein
LKKNEFEIGKKFYTEAGEWRCTDIGTRVITAIQLDQSDPRNYNGPPYSISEYVFDEYDIEGCSHEAIDSEENYLKLRQNKKLSNIYDGFLLVNAGGYCGNEAILDKKTGKIYHRSDYGDIEELEEQLSEEDFDEAIHIEIPHKNDLDLGRDLVFEFMAKFSPEHEEEVNQMFRKKGAYSKFKYLLEEKDLLEQWYEFENKSELIALSQWCKENEIDITD